MSERKLSCEVVTPERVVYNGEVDTVIARGLSGEVGILPLHTPLVTTLDIGVLRTSFGGKWEYIAVHGGYLEVHDDKVTILADSAEMASMIDVNRAKEAKERAEKEIAEAHERNVDFYDAEKALRRALARLHAVNKA